MKNAYKLLVMAMSDPLYQKIVSSLEVSKDQSASLIKHALGNGEVEMFPVKQSENDKIEENRAPVSIFVKDRDYFRRIEFSRIRWIEASGSYSCLNLAGEPKLMLPYNLAELSGHLPSGLFVRVHRSFIVNIPFVDSFIGNMLCIGKEKIPISRQHKKDILERLNILGSVK